MRRRWPSFTPLALLALSLALPAAADDAAAPELLAAEKSALKKVERELLDLAKFAAKGNDAAAARAALQLAADLLPDPAKAQQELEKLEKRPPRGTPKESFAEKLAEKRAEAHKEAALALADAALATKDEAADRHARYVELLKRRLQVEEALAKLDLAYFPLYLRWVTTADKALLERGGEVHGDERLEPDAVAAQDRQHATWSDPWVVSDEVHEVRTTLPLRTAYQLLGFVGEYRRYFLERFSTWDLRPPSSGKLPIIVTRTQAELREQMQAAAQRMGGGVPQGPMNGAALYLMTNQALNPCFVTYEPVDATGTMFKIERFEQLVIPLIHEVTHQIACEYSKYDYDRSRMPSYHFWSIEAIANYMCYHVLEDGQWRLTRPAMIPMGPGMIEGPFSWCQKNPSRLTQLERFMGQSQREFMTVENYHLAATLAYFLLEGQGGKYRERFVKLLALVHRVKDTPNTFAACFQHVDMPTLEKEFAEFVKKIPIDK